MVGMRQINEYVLLSTDVDPKEEYAMKSLDFFFELYAFIILTSTLVLGINYFVIITRPLHPIPVRKRSSSSCYMIETYNTRHRFPCY